MIRQEKVCSKCGGVFEFYPAPSGLVARKSCADCARLAEGYHSLSEFVSTSTWWKPWTWGTGTWETYWTADEARIRVKANIAKYKAGH